MEGKGPFIHKFATAANKYIYDVNTNEIIKVDDCIYDIIDDWGVLPKGEIQSKFVGKYNADLIAERLNSIEAIHRGRGAFSSARLKGISIDPALVEEAIRAHLGQLILGVTERCNLRCRYCVFSGKYEYRRTHSSASMPFHVARRAIDYFLNHVDHSDRIHLSFYGGEPLLNWKVIREAVRYYKAKVDPQKEARWSITTNGTLLNDEVIQFFIENEGTLYVSLDGPQEIHDANRIFPDDGGSYEVVAQNLEKVRAYDKKYYQSKAVLQAVLSPFSDLVEVQSFFAQSDLADVLLLMASQVNPNHTTYFDDINEALIHRFSAQFESMVITYEEAAIRGELENHKRELRLAERTCSVPLWRLYKRDISNLTGRMIPIPPASCLTGFTRLFVTPSGQFYPCEKCSSTLEALRIGEVRRGIEQDRVMELLNWYADLTDCANCWALRLCDVCVVRAEGEDGLSAVNKREACKGSRAAVHSNLRRFCSIMEKNPAAFQYLGGTEEEEFDRSRMKNLFICVYGKSNRTCPVVA